jgi:hypothetical protein
MTLVKTMVADAGRGIVKTHTFPPVRAGRALDDGRLIVDGSWTGPEGFTRGYVVDREKIRQLSKAELIAQVVAQQPTAMELRILYGVWSDTDPTTDRFEAEFAAFATACRAAGWGVSEKARKASATAAPNKETRTMTAKTTLRPDERLAGAAMAYSVNNNIPIDEATMLVGQADPKLMAQYLPLAAPKAGPTVAPMPWSAASIEADRRAKEYAAQHDVDYDTALGAVFAADAGLRKAYTSAPVAVKTHGLIAETEAETLLRGLSKEQLLTLAVQRKLGAPGLAGEQQDAIAQISIYDWIVTTGGQEHGSRAAAEMRDAMWREVIKRRFAQDGFSTAVGR